MSKTTFDKKLWAPIGARLKELRDGEPVDQFLKRHNLQGLRWRMIEDGRQGMTVESLIKLCHETHVSLRWLLLGDEAQRFSPQAPPIEEIVRWLEEYLKSLPPEQRTKEMQKLYGILKEAERNDRFRKKTDPDVSTRRNRSAEKTAASGSPMVHGRGDEGNGRDKKRNGENGQ